MSTSKDNPEKDTTKTEPKNPPPPKSTATENISETETTTTLISIANSFVSALSNKSRPEFERHCLKAGGMALCAPQPAPVRFCTIDSFIDRVTAMRDEIHERCWDHEVKVYEQGNLATVWAPFRAKINGVVDHVGVNLLILHKLNGVWKITGVADSSRKPTDEERQME